MTGKRDGVRIAGLLVAIGILLSLRPVSDAELWWRVSRGRVALNGNIRPTSTLVLQHDKADTDWLNGTLASMAWDHTGAFGLMALQIGTTLLLICLLQKAARDPQSPASVLIVVLVLAATGDAIGPSTKMFDVLATAFAAWLIVFGRFRSLLLLLILWANASPGAIWGMPACLTLIPQRAIGKKQMAFTLLVPLSMCLTPRGLAGLSDMLSLSFPYAFFDPTLLQLAGGPSTHLSISHVYAAALVIAALLQSRISLPPKLFLALAGIAAFVLHADAAPIATVAGALMLQSLRPGAADASASSRRPLIGWPLVAGVSVAVIMASAAAGHRPGWGIADSIDPRFAERDLTPDKDAAFVAHATSVRSAGLLLLHCPKAQVIDTWKTAVRNGRLRSFALLNHDLRAGQQSAYRRLDGTSGGWWPGLIHRNVTLLAVDAEQHSMHRALEPTLWKPLSLDGPGVCYGRAGIPRYSARILETQTLRHFLQTGPWQHQLLSFSEQRLSVDFATSIIGRPDVRPDIRQARMFLAMQMPIAAVRTVHPVLTVTNSSEARQLMQQLQQYMAWMEWMHTGQVSTFRIAAAQAAEADRDIPAVNRELLTQTIAAAQQDQALQRAVTTYLSGNPAAAADRLTPETAEHRYARAVMYLEAGKPQQAQQEYSALQQQFTEFRLTDFLTAVFEGD